MDNINKLLNVLRDCNTTIRWLMLHRTSRLEKIRKVVQATTTPDDLLSLLLNISQFEFTLKNMFTELLETKKTRLEEYRTESKERMTELAEYFSGEKALTRIKKDDNLQGWFTNLASEIAALDWEKPIQAGRKINHLMQVLNDVEEFHQIATSLQVRDGGNFHFILSFSS